MRILFALFCFCFAFTLRATAIAVVHAELSVPEAERRFAKSLATHVQRWYDEAGVKTALIPDKTLTASSPYKLVILVDCYQPPASVVSTVKALLKRGTRFVVCYSASPELAALFGLKPGSYVRSDDGAWSSMSFGADKPQGAPVTILQTSTNLFTVLPTQKETRSVAWWCNRAGKRTETAWWRTAQGSYWMTHVLSGDGDETGKQRLLLSIAAESVPDVWNQAARHCFNQALIAIKDGSFLKRTWSLPKTSERRKQLDKLFELIRQMQIKTQRLVEARAGYEAYQSARDLQDVIARAYGMTFWSRPGEIIGVWDHPEARSPRQVAQMPAS